MSCEVGTAFACSPARRMFRRPRQIDITATVLPAYSDTHEGSLAKKESIGLGHGHCNVFENSCTWRTYYAPSKFRPSNESTARRSRPQKERPTLVAPHNFLAASSPLILVEPDCMDTQRAHIHNCRVVAKHNFLLLARLAVPVSRRSSPF